MEIVVPQPFQGSGDVEMDSGSSESENQSSEEEIVDDYGADGAGSLDWEDMDSEYDSSDHNVDPLMMDQQLNMENAYHDDYPEHETDEEESEDASEMFNGMIDVFETQAPATMDETDLSSEVMRNFRNALNSTGRRMDYEIVDLDEFPMMGSLLPRNSTSDDFIHPLLRERQSGNQNNSSSLRNPFSITVADNIDPGSLFERVFNRSTIRSGFNGIPDFNRTITIQPNVSPTNTASVVEIAPNPANFNAQIENLHLYRLGYTDERWKQECRLFFGSATVEIAMKHSNEIVNALLPKAFRDYENSLREQPMEETKIQNPVSPLDDQLNSETQLHSATAPSTDNQEIAERQIITVDGSEVDITGNNN